MSDTWWEALDASTGERCGHVHHSRDHAMRCASARYLHPTVEKRTKDIGEKPEGYMRDRLAKSGAFIDYEERYDE